MISKGFFKKTYQKEIICCVVPVYLLSDRNVVIVPGSLSGFLVV